MVGFWRIFPRKLLSIYSVITCRMKSGCIYVAADLNRLKWTFNAGFLTLPRFHIHRKFDKLKVYGGNYGTRFFGNKPTVYDRVQD
jgi:hypothetical protein